MLHGEGVERAFLILSTSTSIERGMIAERIREEKDSQEIEGNEDTPGVKSQEASKGYTPRE